MKWVTRERARVDRIACPWLISRFIDREPTFLFVPSNQVLAVAEREKAIPYDVPNVELGHHGDHCSFDAFLDKYQLTDPALQTLSKIVRGADTDARELTPESSGLYALATGFQAIAKDDHDNMAKQFPAYDALYAYCRTAAAGGPRAPGSDRWRWSISATSISPRTRPPADSITRPSTDGGVFSTWPTPRTTPST